MGEEIWIGRVREDGDAFVSNIVAALFDGRIHRSVSDLLLFAFVLWQRNHVLRLLRRS